MIHIARASVHDGTGREPFVGDLLLDGDRIAALGPSVPVPPGAERFDASGLAAAPGFIDMHGHNDLRVFEPAAVLPKLLQGITTEVVGQDGISLAPLPRRHEEAWRAYLAEFDGENAALDLDFPDAASYLDRLDGQRAEANYCYFAPHGNLRLEAMGLENRPAGEADLARMGEALRRDLDGGCFGFSTGLIYAPCSYAGTEELAHLCSVAAERDALFMVHQRSEADGILESMAEILDLGRRTGVRVHFSHFKACGLKNVAKLGRMFALLDAAEADGVRISFDQYPYIAGSTSLGVALPPWAHDGGVDLLLSRLADPGCRERMRRDIVSGLPGWDNFVDFAGYAGIFLASSPSGRNAASVGRSLMEIAAARASEPAEVLMDLVLEEENRALMVDFYGTEEAAERIMLRPEMTGCSDGILEARPHPRVRGAFPRLLGRYARDRGLFSLSEGVAKLTGRAAETLGLRDRGFLRPGFFADLVLFDPSTISDNATFDDPTLPPTGIVRVYVNGACAVDNGAPAAAGAGRALRRNAV